MNLGHVLRNSAFRAVTRLRRALLPVGVGVAAFGCGPATSEISAAAPSGNDTASAAATSSGPSDAPITVRVSGERFGVKNAQIDKSTIAPLTDHAVMNSGEGYTLTVDLSRPALVYLLHFTPAGKGTIAYPVEGDPRDARAHHVIPGEADVILRLDAEPGPELLYVIVTEKPLAVAAPELAAIVREIETAPPDAVLPITIAADTAAPPPASSATAPAPLVPIAAAPKQTSCGPILMRKDANMRPRGSGECGGRSELKGRPRGQLRQRLGAEIFQATADLDGVVAYPVLIDHR